MRSVFPAAPPLVLSALLLFGACATRPPASDPEAVAEYEQTNDPLEPTNRAMFDVHEAIDRAVLEPVARAYRAVLPQPVRDGVRNALGNLRTPVVLLNDLLQGETERARTTLARFMVNSTLGLGGFIDVAEHWGTPGHNEDFGQTLAVWGLGEGPYLFVPVLGPSNPRDLFGYGVDVVASPFTWIGQGVAVDAANWTRVGLTVVDTREALLDPIREVRETSLDPYATLRSAYRQRRAFEIQNRDGQAGQTDPGAAGGAGISTPGR